MLRQTALLLFANLLQGITVKLMLYTSWISFNPISTGLFGAPQNWGGGADSTPPL